MSLRLRLLVLAVGTFALGTDGYVIAGLLPAVGRSLHVSAAAAGQLVTVFAMVFALAATIGGVLTANLSRKPVLVASMILFTIANALAAAAPDYPLMMVARILAAVAAALFTPAASAVAAGLVPSEQRGVALAFVMGGITAATALGVPLGTALGAVAGWRSTLAAVAGLGLVATLSIAVLLPAVPAPPAAGWSARLRVARRPGVPATLAVTGVWIAGGFTVYTYLAAVLAHLGAIHGGALSAWFLIFGLAAMIGNALGGRLTDRGHGSRVLLAGVVGLGGGVLILAALAQSGASHATGATGAAIALAIWGIGGWAFNPAQQHRLITLAPDSAPVVLSLNVSVFYAGIAAGGLIGGLALAHGGVSTLCWSATALEAVALVTLIASSRRRRDTSTLSHRPDADVRQKEESRA